jgi:hypothetical protein
METQKYEDKKRKKKTTHPLLMLMQRGSYTSRKSEFLRQISKDVKLISSPTDAGNTVEKAAAPSLNYCEHPGPAPQTSSYIWGSFYPSWADLCSPSASEKCLSWIDKVSSLRRMSSCLSRGLSFSSHLSPSDLSRRPSLSKISSSYTSWTKPIAGPISDSFCPASSILDNDDNNDLDDNDQKMDGAYYDKNKRRKSSADTCKDIDDIEDFELDAVQPLSSLLMSSAHYNELFF